MFSLVYLSSYGLIPIYNCWGRVKYARRRFCTKNNRTRVRGNSDGKNKIYHMRKIIILKILIFKKYQLRVRGNSDSNIYLFIYKSKQQKISPMQK